MADRILKEREGRYVLDFYTPEGERVRRIIGTVIGYRRQDGTILNATRKAPYLSREQAEAQETEIELYLKTGKRPSAAVLTVGDYYRSKYKKWHEDAFPRSHFRVEIEFRMWLLPFFDSMGLDQVDADAIDRWVDWRIGKQPDVSRSTLQKGLQTLQAMLNKAVLDKKITGLEINPAAGAGITRGVGHSKRPRGWYDSGQLRQLYAAEEIETWRWIWQLFASTGMRRTEALNLLKAKVDLSAERLTVQASERHHVKTETSERDIDLNDAAREALAWLMDHVEGPYVLPRFHKTSITHRCSKTLKKAGLPGSLHWLRHSFISHLVNSPAVNNLKIVQELAGHASLSTTMGYSHVDRRRTLAAVKSIKTG